MNRFQHPSRLLLAALLPLFLATAAVHAAPNRVLTIAAARALPVGTVVTVSGAATSPSGVFDSSFFDKGFSIQDATGGIFVSLQENVPVVPRVRVVVTGVLKDSSGLLVVAPASPSAISFHGLGPKVGAEWVQTNDVSEATEGRIVLVVGRISTAPSSDLPYGYKVAVDDGSGPAQIFINLGTGIDVSHLAAGDLISVTGFSSQFDTHYEVDPRGPADIVLPEH